ncbi:MAG: cytochrome c [Zavarzinella sp.]
MSNHASKARYVRSGILVVLILTFTACQQRMAHQPANRTLSESDFFSDQRSARPLEDGTIHRSQYLSDDPMATGLSVEGQKAQRVAIGPNPQDNIVTGPGIANNVDNFVSKTPFKMTLKDLQRGQQRYQIHCSPCHGTVGDGMGKIVERGYLAPPNYHKDNSRAFQLYKVPVSLREIPIGYFYHVITKGYGGMPNFASDIAVTDRWRIAAYVRALQYSQNFDSATVDPEVWKKMQESLGGNK